MSVEINCVFCGNKLEEKHHKIVLGTNPPQDLPVCGFCLNYGINSINLLQTMMQPLDWSAKSDNTEEPTEKN